MFYSIISVLIDVKKKSTYKQTIKIMEEKYFYEELQETLEELHTKVENGIVLTFNEEEDSIWDW